MSQPVLNTTPLFQTTLRQWQAEFKANRVAADGAAPAAAPRRLVGLSRPVRLGRAPRRSR
jgi:hypothetical protein